MADDADLLQLWERQPGESEIAYYCFTLYRDQETPRGYAKVASESSRSLPLIKRWGRKWVWRERTRAWDRNIEEQARIATVKETRQMATRQARDMHAIELALMQPVEVLLKRLNDPIYAHELEQLKTGDLIALTLMAGRVLPRVLRAEREARGAPIQDLTQFLDEDTGETRESRTPAELYDWGREALAVLESATGGRLGLPPGDVAPTNVGPSDGVIDA